jgi:hypothetical protein
MKTTPHREQALCLAIGRGRTHDWLRARGKGSPRTIGELFRRITDEERTLVEAWETVLASPNQSVGFDGVDIHRRTNHCCKHTLTLPAIEAGFLTYTATKNYESTEFVVKSWGLVENEA